MNNTVVPDRFTRNRKVSYLIAFTILCVLFIASRGSDWHGSKELHTIMEVVATLLALIVGIMALVRFYSKKNNIILFIGAGFLGTALLDGYHAVVTSKAYAPYLPSDLPALIPWSWVASRLFLSLVLFLSWYIWKREQNRGQPYDIKEKHVYAIVAILTLASFLFFAFAPLPRAYYPEYFFGRPEEFIPAVFFLIALIGTLKKNKWKEDPFEHWLVLALLISLASQIMFMPFSHSLFDFDFDMAHTLKKITYILVLVGLLSSMYVTFKEAEKSTKRLSLTSQKYKKAELLAKDNAEKLRTIFDAVPDGIITTDQTGVIQAFNSGAEEIFGYEAKEVKGQNIKMLMPENFARNHDSQIRNYEKGQGVSAIGKRRDLIGLRKDGSTFAIDLTINISKTEDETKTITGIVRDITTQKKAETERARFVNELEKTNEELEQFAYVASHDLKAPLRGIDNLANFIREDVGDDLDEDTLNNFDLMQNRIHRMERLLDDLLAYSRAGRKKYSFETINLNELLNDIIALTSVPDGFDIQVNGTAGEIHTIQTPLQQVLMNIISNAIKHHDQQTGKIAVDISESPKFVELSISDDGPGIPEQFHDRIFKMFQTLKPRDDVEGSGMGLAIVKKVVESIGGSIEINSEDGKRGTHFLILWPKEIERTEDA